MRTGLLIAVLLAVAASAGAAAKPAQNGLIVFASIRGQDREGEIYSVGARGGASRNLSKSRAADTLPAVSPTGRRIAFFSRRPGYGALYVEDLGGTGLRRLTGRRVVIEPTSVEARGIAWAPGEDALAVQAVNGLYVVITRGGNVNRVADASRSAIEPSWSADGRRLAYTERKEYPDPWSVDVIRRDGKQLWSRTGHGPQWSARGAMLAYGVTTSGPPGDLVVADAGGDTLARFPDSTLAGWSPDGNWIAFIQLHRFPSYETDVAVAKVGDWGSRTIATGSRALWSPDSSRLAVTDFASPSYEMVSRVVDVRTGEQALVAEDASPLGWSLDGRRLALSDETSPFADNGHYMNCGTVLTVRPDGTDPRRAVAPPPATSAYWSGWARGGTIVYLRLAGSSLYTVRPDGQGLKRLVSDGGCADSSPAWSPDGRQIAFARETMRQGTRSLYVRTTADATAKPLGHGCCSDVSEPAWSPDGKRIAFNHGFHTVDLIGLDDTEPATLLTGGDDLTWSPDGSEIAYVYRYGGIVVAPAGEPFRSTPAASGSQPAWSPDGQWIAYWAQRKIREAHPDGTEDHEIVSAPADTLSSPAWSPDGNSIVYAQAGDLWVVRADGTGRRRLTSGEPLDASPSWQPVFG